MIRISRNHVMILCAGMAALALPAPAFAMHISEGILPLPWAFLWWAVAIPFVAWGLRTIRARSGETPIFTPMLGLVGAAVFVISCTPVPIPGTGSSSHPCGTGLAVILIGPQLTVVVSSVALLLQALFLGDGGFSTLGANTVSMGVAGAFFGYGAFRLALRLKTPFYVAAFLAGLLADWTTYAATSLLLAAGVHGEGSFATTAVAFVAACAPTQLPLGILEGFLTAGAISFLRSRRPEMIRQLAGERPA